jgi:phosphatidylinositol-4,5-bisphosphate 3-kinase
MGGQKSADFLRFEQYCSEAFNILRKNSFTIINLLMMMVSAEIPQLKSYTDLQYVVDKLDLDLSKTQAA